MSQQSKEELDAVAALIGTTSASLKQVDQQLIEPSSNLQQSAKNWNPESVLKEHITQAGGITPPPGDAPGYQDTPPPPPPDQGYAQPVIHQQPVMQPIVQLPGDLGEKLDRIEKKLDILMGDVKDLTVINENVGRSVERGLKGKMKQITIKFDDAQSKT